MAPVRSRKRKSDDIAGDAVGDDELHAQTLPTKTGTPGISPSKRRNTGITLAQKQALIDNLQLEITERARRLRAQYNVQAQQLRSRVEMRVNRIPRALRKASMGDLLAKHSEPPQQPRPRSPYSRPPPVPAKDGTSPKTIPRKPVATVPLRAAHKRLSDEVRASDDKENSVEPVANPKKRLRNVPATAGTGRDRLASVLSPTSSNVRIMPLGLERPGSPAKPGASRPASPVKASAAKSSNNILSNIVEKAKTTRGAAARGKALNSSTTSSNSSRTTTTRTRKPPVPAAAKPTSTRGRRKASTASESSEKSTSTVVKKTTRAAAAKAAPATKRGVMSTIKSAATKKAQAGKTGTTTRAGTGRTLRKRAA